MPKTHFHNSASILQAAPKPRIKPQIYVDVTVDETLENRLFTGFSGTISDGGVFVTTYVTHPLNAPVVVRLNLFGVHRIAVNGYIQWLRELNPLVPDQSPGLGIRFVDLDAIDEQILNACLVEYPAYFYDDSRIGLPCAALAELATAAANPKDEQPTPPPAAIETSAALPQLDADFAPSDPVVAGEMDDFDYGYKFFDGLRRDISMAAQRAPTVGVERPATSSVLFAPSSPATGEPPQSPVASSQEPSPRPAADHHIRARLMNDLCSTRQFQAGCADQTDGLRGFIASYEPLPCGSLVQIQLQLSRLKTVVLFGRVTWVRRHNPLIQGLAKPGMGVALEAVGPTEAYALKCHAIDSSNSFYCEAINDWGEMGARADRHTTR